MTELDETPTTAGVSRRTMIRGATVGGVALPLLAACGGGGNGSSASGSGDQGGGGGVTVAASSVPVGGGTILNAQQVVVTQPTKGDFKAFTAICTHQGCTVGKVENGEIVCPCHGSHFSITNGKPVSGPAQSPLASKQVSEKGGRLTVS